MSQVPRNIYQPSRQNHYDATPNEEIGLDSSSSEPLHHIPPKPPRSAFMCYTDEMKQELMTSGNAPSSSEEKILNIVATKWRSLTDRQRAEWEEISRQDKVRFAREKAEYKGPWEVPKRRARKHPLAPKRPMSAFLKYSQKRRQDVKEANPEMNNTDISRLLGEMWRAADASEKEPYVESEKVERAIYNEAIATWREEQAHLDAASRTSHHSVQQQSVHKNLEIVPPVKKKRRENYHQSTTSDSSRTTTAAIPVGHVVDRRIFRSYSGSSHPIENKPYIADQRKYHSQYSIDSALSYNSKSDTNSYYPHKLSDEHQYKSEPVSTSTNSSMNTIHPIEYPTRQYPNTYRPTYPPIPLPPQGENRHTAQLPSTGSDLFDNPFHDPEPPFNPRQTRPSSHYNNYFYP